MDLKSIRLYNSSSTTSTLRVLTSPGTTSGVTVASGLTRLMSPSMEGISHLMVVPIFFLLLHSIVPFCRSTSFLTMERPRPVPPYLRVVLISSCVKSSKIDSILSSSMPMPVSANSITRIISGCSFLIPFTEKCTVPSLVNLTELLTRFIIICFSRYGSPIKTGGVEESTVQLRTVLFFLA